MQDARIESARRTAHFLYAGVETPHRSCGIALAETFGLKTAAYQAFRRGGITGEGPCGAIAAGLIVLGEILGDPDPTGPVTDALRLAATDYERRWKAELLDGAARPDIACNHLTAPLGEFSGARRHGFCTHLVATVAAIVAEVALEHGAEIEVRARRS